MGAGRGPGGRFTIERSMAAGGMGRMYRATDALGGVVVALEVIRADAKPVASTVLASLGCGLLAASCHACPGQGGPHEHARPSRRRARVNAC